MRRQGIMPSQGFDGVSPDGIDMRRRVCKDLQRGTVMLDVASVWLDLAKNVFRILEAYGTGGTVLRKKLQRDQILAFSCQSPLCVVVVEACGGANF